jgi:predicted house-cleaning noncanonical NTP pyrophosphatase (MazG superfamily)
MATIEAAALRLAQSHKCPQDRLEAMMTQQDAFMHLLQEKRGFPEYPVDLASKQGQKFVKSIAYDAMHELFEAIQLLKNSKDHRATEVKEWDREAYVEELVDHLHFYFEIVHLSGVSMDELYEAYMKKGEVNTQRILGGY